MQLARNLPGFRAKRIKTTIHLDYLCIFVGISELHDLISVVEIPNLSMDEVRIVEDEVVLALDSFLKVPVGMRYLSSLLPGRLPFKSHIHVADFSARLQSSDEMKFLHRESWPALHSLSSLQFYVANCEVSSFWQLYHYPVPRETRGVLARHIPPGFSATGSEACRRASNESTVLKVSEDSCCH